MKSPSTTAPQNPIGNKSFTVNRGRRVGAQKIVAYGAGGSGKSTLFSLLPAKPLFIDLEQGSHFLDVDRIDNITTWDELRSVLHDQALWADYGAVVIDSFTKAEELAIAWTLQNVKHEKGHTVDSIEGYGFGKGVVHVYETFLQLLGDLDSHIRAGRHVGGICHECTANVPNPSGEDWIRYEPRLQSPASGKSSIRHRVKEWTDHLLFIGYDVAVNKDGKGMGGGTRTIHPVEMPTHWAKSRCLANEIPYEKGSGEIWTQLFKGDSNGNG